MTLLARVHEELDRRGIAHALIGAAALAVRGIARSTLDLDLLTGAASCLEPETWAALGIEGAGVDVRRGDAEDPLAGVIRLTQPPERPVDVVVAKLGWQRDIIAGGGSVLVLDADLPVATVPGLILLKLYAGGPQDLWDVEQLLGIDGSAAVAVSAEILKLPARARDLWAAVLARHA
jgi:hypothetical protein